MRRFILMFAVTGLAFVTQVQSSRNESTSAGENDRLLEIGRAAQLRSSSTEPDEIRIVSYNIRWRGGDELRKLATALREDEEIGGARILGLQEVDRNRKRTGNVNTAKTLAEELGMYYAWAAPPLPKGQREEETGVMLLSEFPLTEVRRIVLPHLGPEGRRRVAVGATLKVGKSNWRVYSVHAETRIPVAQKLDQMSAVLKDLAGYPKEMPAVVMGDLNTWEPDLGTETTKLFTEAGFKTPFDDSSTFSRRVLLVNIDLKLDWVWLRNLDSTKFGIDKRISLSDHWPLWLMTSTRAR